MRIATASPAEVLAGLGHSTGDSYTGDCADDRAARESQVMRKPRHVKGTGSVFTRPGSPYLYVGYWNGKRFVKESAKTTDRQVAQALLDKRRAAVKEGTPDPSQVDRITVNELLADLEKHYELHEQPSLSTLKVHNKAVRADLSGVQASAITYGRLLKLAEKWLEAGASKGTCNRRLGALRRAYRLAQRDGRVTRIPEFPHFSEVDAVRTGFVEPADFARFLAAIPDTDVQDFIAWLGATGQRVGEARKLRWSYVQGDQLHIPATDTKTRKARVLPLVADLAEIIERRRAGRRLDCPFIFHRGGQPVREFRGPWGTALQATGLCITPHDLRRSGVRNLINAGVDRDVARAISGHRTESVFSRYNITSPEQVAAALKKVAAYTREQAAKAAKVKKLGA